MNWSKRGTAEARSASTLRAPAEVLRTPSAADEPKGGTKPASAGATSGDAQAQELAELRLHAKKLETALATYRAQEELFSEAFVAATRYARKLKEDARQEAELALRKARARAEEVLGGIERDRLKAERELLRLRRAGDETRADLSAFLTSALDGLRFEATDTASEPASQPGLTEALHDVLEDTLRKEGASDSASTHADGLEPGRAA